MTGRMQRKKEDPQLRIGFIFRYSAKRLHADRRGEATVCKGEAINKEETGKEKELLGSRSDFWVFTGGVRVNRGKGGGHGPGEKEKLASAEFSFNS